MVHDKHQNGLRRFDSNGAYTAINIPQLKAAIQETLERIPADIRAGHAYRQWAQFSDEIDLLKPLTDALRSQDDLALFDGKMRHIGRGAARVEFVSLASWIVARSLDVSPDMALANLQQYVSEPEFGYLKVMVVAGVAVASNANLDGGVELVPFQDVPELIYDPILWRGSPNWAFPSAALIHRGVHPRIHLEPDESWESPEHLSSGDELDEALLCLALAGPSPVVSLGTWIVGETWVPLADRSSWGWGPRTPPLFPLALRKMDSRGCARAQELHELYRALNEPSRRHLRIPLERLNSAMQKASGPEAAIDLRIAIESALLDDTDAGEFRFRASLRAARLLGTNTEDRMRLMQTFQDLYDVGSKAVHTGGLPRRLRNRDPNQVLKEGFAHVGQVIERIIRGGGVDWERVTLGT